MYILYSGIGGALITVSSVYKYYYFIFSICISIGIYYGLHAVQKRNAENRKLWSEYLTYFIDNYADKIIISYYICSIVPLLYPEFRLQLLLSPPAPDVLGMLKEKFGGGEEENIIVSVISGIRGLIFPLYLLSLYKYREKFVKLSIIILIPYYIKYCATAYMGRSDMLEAMILILGVVYFEKPKLGKRIVLAAALFMPALLIFFVKYSIERIGGTADNISTLDAVETLLEQESNYPLHFKEVLHLQGTHFFNYLVWLTTMPLPGIFRGGIDVHFAAMFSEDILGITRTDKGFYILLPGVVGESVYLLGKNLFWVNGLIYGYVMGFVTRILLRYPQLICIAIYVAIDFGYVTNRAGFFGGFPFIGKILLYAFIFLWFLRKYTKWEQKSSLLSQG